LPDEWRLLAVRQTTVGLPNLSADPSIKPKFSLKVTGVQSAYGNIALTQATCSVTGTDSDGKPVTMSGRSVEILRRQVRRNLKAVSDNPRGRQDT
jgi:ketosteroid isomerase-like protein